MIFTTKELEWLEDVLNEAIESYLQSGYSIQDEYIVCLRNILKKLNLKEYYEYDKWK